MMMANEEASIANSNSNTSGDEGSLSTNKSAGQTTVGSGSGSNSRSTGGDDAKYFAQDIDRRVKGMKYMVYLVLFAVAVAVCLAVFFITDKGQQDEFEAAFHGDAVRVIRSFEEIMEQKIAALAAFGVTMTAYANRTSSTWPFVTLNDFQERAASVRSLSEAIMVGMIPVIEAENVNEWGSYSLANKGWLDEGRDYQKYQRGIPDELNGWTGEESQVMPFIFQLDPTSEIGLGPSQGEGPFFPWWQQSPILPRDLVNFNVLTFPLYAQFLQKVADTGQATIGGLMVGPPGGMDSDDDLTAFFAQYTSFDKGVPSDYTGEPLSVVFVPVMDSFDQDSNKAGAVVLAVVQWKKYFEDILSPTALPLRVILSNTCEDLKHTYSINGAEVHYQGAGSLVSTKFDDVAMEVIVDEKGFVFEEETIALSLNQDICRYTLQVYPTQEQFDSYNDNFPFIISATIGAVFLFTVFMIICYDMMIERRQKRILETAKRSTAIVSSIFPRKVRDKLMGDGPVQGNATKLRSLANRSQPKHGNSNVDTSDPSKGGPIADLFPECTVMFADIEGFTAWSSVREPSQVFTLLETLYDGMDTIAARRRVFKVETVGDCYVAVAGLPDPRKEHAVVMGRFARDCIEKFIVLVKELEDKLGPGTQDLRLRVGLNSGPITAGVLRGKGSRFQLFGDTVNTCARVESAGEGNRIHISDKTAQMIRDAGYSQWIQERQEMIHAKGKGELKTFWLTPPSKNNRDKTADTMPEEFSSMEFSTRSTASSSSTSPTKDERYALTGIRKDRLVAWNVEVLLRVVKQIIARREMKGIKTSPTANLASTDSPVWKPTGQMPLKEVVEVISLPRKDTCSDLSASMRQDIQSIPVDAEIVSLLQEYVSFLADMYPPNPFHNFEHASHVTMSVAKLMSRIVAPSDMDFQDGVQAQAQLHDHTYGITSDPLTQFACLLSGLIHDVDHPGVSNATLVMEGTLPEYEGQSPAEQHSVDQAWELLMEPHFAPLVQLLCPTGPELQRLRQLVVNCVLATDIMDPQLKQLRNARWTKAFTNGASAATATSSQEAVNRKATIVLEHLMQASDVSHTMQHWNVYIKWNSRLFRELYKAFLDGRMGAKDPSVFWVQGEVQFLDKYVVPLARKLKECGVFGASSDEYLNYVQSNRNEWATKGDQIVRDLVLQVQQEYGQQRWHAEGSGSFQLPCES